MNTGKLQAKSLKQIASFAWKHKAKIRPEYNNIKVSINGECRVEWQGLESHLVATIPVEHDGDDFTVVVGSEKLSKLLKSSGVVSIADDKTVTVGSCTTAVPHVENSKGESWGESPIRLAINDELLSKYVVDASSFFTAYDNAGECIDLDCSRYALGGVFLRPIFSGLDVVATDGKRLLVSHVPCDTSSVERESAIVPVYAGLSKLFPDGQLTIEIHQNDVVFAGGDVRFSTRRIEGRFPAYDQIIPELGGTDSGETVDVLVSDVSPLLEDAAKAWNSFKRPTEEDFVRCEFLFGGGQLSIRGNIVHVTRITDMSTKKTSSVERSTEVLRASCKCSDSEPISVRLDPTYLLDFIKMVGKKTTLSVQFNSKIPEMSPIRIDADGMVYVVMPIS